VAKALGTSAGPNLKAQRFAVKKVRFWWQVYTFFKKVGAPPSEISPDGEVGAVFIF
jgi:hypothetical protein